MSDSITKYYEMVEDVYIYETPDGGKTVRQRKLLDHLRNKPQYTELQLVETVANLARQYKDMDTELLLQLAKDELAVKKVCD